MWVLSMEYVGTFSVCVCFSMGCTGILILSVQVFCLWNTLVPSVCVLSPWIYLSFPNVYMQMKHRIFIAGCLEGSVHWRRKVHQHQAM